MKVIVKLKSKKLFGWFGIKLLKINIDDSWRDSDPKIQDQVIKQEVDRILRETKIEKYTLCPW